jgi:hypothetical protein
MILTLAKDVRAQAEIKSIGGESLLDIILALPNCKGAPQISGESTLDKNNVCILILFKSGGAFYLIRLSGDHFAMSPAKPRLIGFTDNKIEFSIQVKIEYDDIHGDGVFGKQADTIELFPHYDINEIISFIYDK